MVDDHGHPYLRVAHDYSEMVGDQQESRCLLDLTLKIIMEKMLVSEINLKNADMHVAVQLLLLIASPA